jgi:hypothetical protein
MQINRLFILFVSFKKFRLFGEKIKKRWYGFLQATSIPDLKGFVYRRFAEEGRLVAGILEQ